MGCLITLHIASGRRVCGAGMQAELGSEMEEMTLHVPKGQRVSKLSDGLHLGCLGTRYTPFPTILAAVFALPSVCAMFLPSVARRTTVRPPLLPPLNHGIEYVGRRR